MTQQQPNRLIKVTQFSKFYHWVTVDGTALGALNKPTQEGPWEWIPIHTNFKELMIQPNYYRAHIEQQIQNTLDAIEA